MLSQLPSILSRMIVLLLLPCLLIGCSTVPSGKEHKKIIFYLEHEEGLSADKVNGILLSLFEHKSKLLNGSYKILIIKCNDEVDDCDYSALSHKVPDNRCRDSIDLIEECTESGCAYSVVNSGGFCE